MTADSAPITDAELDFLESACASEPDWKADNQKFMAWAAMAVSLTRHGMPRLIAEVRRLRGCIDKMLNEGCSDDMREVARNHGFE